MDDVTIKRLVRLKLIRPAVTAAPSAETRHGIISAGRPDSKIFDRLLQNRSMVPADKRPPAPLIVCATSNRDPNVGRSGRSMRALDP